MEPQIDISPPLSLSRPPFSQINKNLKNKLNHLGAVGKTQGGVQSVLWEINSGMVNPSVLKLNEDLGVGLLTLWKSVR